MNSTQYELPDGKTIDVGPERYKTCELMFNPSLLEVISSLQICIYVCVDVCMS